MRQIVLLYSIIVLALSCKHKTSSSFHKLKGSEQKITVSTIDSAIARKIKLFNSGYYSTKKSTKIKDLVGLAIRDSSATNPFNKYEIDFYHLCYGGVYNWFIDLEEKVIFSYKYNMEPTPLTIENINFWIEIENILNKNDQVTLHVGKVYRNKNSKFVNKPFERIVIEINEMEPSIVELKLDSSGEIDFRNVFRYNTYTYKKFESKFPKASCGDFDG